MAKRIDPADLSTDEAAALLASALHNLELARMAGGMAKGRQRKRCEAIAAQHSRNAIALADRLYGAPTEAETMTDAQLLAALTE